MACLVILLFFALIQWLAVPDEEEGKHVHCSLTVLKVEAVGNSTHTPQKPRGGNRVYHRPAWLDFLGGVISELVHHCWREATCYVEKNWLF